MSAYSQLVPNKVGAGYEVRGNVPPNSIFGSIFPGFIKIDCFHALQNIDARGGTAHLKYGCRAIVEVRRTHSGEGCAEFGKRAEDSLTVFLICLDEEIQIFRSTRL